MLSVVGTSPDWLGDPHVRWIIRLLALVTAFAVLAPAAHAGDYDDPFFLGWSAFLPAVPGDFTASAEKDCPTGSMQCVDNVIREMTRRWEKLGCDHNAPFALVYLRTTEEYREAAATPGFFEDAAFVNHQDAVFADYYFQAYDDWYTGKVDRVAPAWRIAFDAADRRKVTGMGDILLGMNAHINRDLPFVLHAIGLTKPDGTTRKTDHDAVNIFLNEVAKYVIAEAAQRYDPTIDDGDLPLTTLDSNVLMSAIMGWREQAWRYAEMLRDAPTEADRARVAQLIEDQAALEALTIRTTHAYDGLLRTTRTRDRYCQSQLGG